MKKAQISIPLVAIEPTIPCMQGGSLERSATRLTKIFETMSRYSPSPIYVPYSEEWEITQSNENHGYKTQENNKRNY